MRFKKFGIGGNSKQETRSGKNVFNNTKTPDKLIGATATTIETGVRITSTGEGTWRGVIYVIKDLSNYVGKVVRVKSTMTPNGENQCYLVIGICSSSGDNRTTLADRKISGEANFIIPEFTDSNTYLFITLNSNSTGTGVEGSYVDYTNLIITIDNEDTSYEPYGAMPSPDYRSEVKSCGDNINYFDEELELGSIDNTTGENAENNSTIRSKNHIVVLSNQELTISNDKQYSNYIYEYDKDKNFIKYTANNQNPYTFITSSTTKYIKFRTIATSKQNDLTTKFKLEKGKVATPYSPYGQGCINEVICNGLETTDTNYKAQTYSIPTQQPMRAVGDIRDTFIKKNNKWFENHPIIRKIFDGTEDWNLYTSDNARRFGLSITGNMPKLITTTSNGKFGKGFCSHFETQMNYTTTDLILFVQIANSIWYIGITDFNSKWTDVTALKTYLAEQYSNGTPVYVDYVLEEPLDIECTPEQNKILDKIEQEAHTYKNVTHIYSTDEVKPVKDVEYYTDTQMNETFAKIQEMEGLKKEVNNFKDITVNVAQFGAVGDGTTDDTEAIQNAINNAGFGGTVEFEKGKDYLVSSTIFVGIGQTLNFNFSNITPATDGTFTNNYVFSINSSDVENWDNAYSSRTTIINKLKADNINLIENLKLMYAPCNLKINWLFSRRFYGSVDSGNFYADMYELNDIYIYDNFGDNYAIYKRGQGDAFVVNKMLIGVFLDNSNMNAISVGSTAGCQLNDVIGGNYSFYNSRSVSINNAHIEVGRIVIKNSQVEINNSYLWKDGANSTIEISDSAVANSKDINFPVVLNNVIFKIRNVKYTYTIEHGDIDISNFNGLLELNNVMRVNEIDSNNYFYESITGISIKTATDTYINTVDNKTCIRNKIIEPVRKIFTTLTSGYYTLTNCSTFESDRSWQGTAGKEYFYKVLVLNDTKRMCGINETNVTNATVKSATPTSSQNVLLNLGKVAGMSLRILRGSALNTFEEYVDIPFCQSRVLVDTGVCINGFKWKTNSSGKYPTINNIFSEDFITNFDGNVHCFGKEKPTVGAWKAGDIVYDITGTTMGWRCTTAGTPGTWVEM